MNTCDLIIFALAGHTFYHDRCALQRSAWLERLTIVPAFVMAMPGTSPMLGTSPMHGTDPLLGQALQDDVWDRPAIGTVRTGRKATHEYAIRLHK